MLIVHYREALKYMINSVEIGHKFIDELEEPTRSNLKDKFEVLISTGEPFESSFLKDICPMRNSTIH
jgi:hypothetical protein